MRDNAALSRIREKLRCAATIYAKERLLMLVGFVRRDRQIGRYLAEHRDERYLRIGAGSHAGSGWLAADLVPEHLNIAYMDNTKPFPLPNRSFDAIVCEHMIEHVPYDAGMNVLGECYRVLKVGGVLRIATPNMTSVCKLIDFSTLDEAATAYVKWSNSTFGGDLEAKNISNPVFVINRVMRAWGHTFLYDERTLTEALVHAGFETVVRVSPGCSEHPALVNVDRHGEEIGERFNEIESLVLEATVGE
jgi:predicted SAM-dependent methyltransferase